MYASQYTFNCAADVPVHVEGAVAVNDTATLYVFVEPGTTDGDVAVNTGTASIQPSGRAHHRAARTSVTKTSNMPTVGTHCDAGSRACD